VWEMSFDKAYARFGRALLAKRESMLIGVRVAAIYCEVSTATYSRAENGALVDIKTFAKLCSWLKQDPNDFLGLKR